MPRKGIKYNQRSEADIKTAIKKYKTGNYGLYNICKLLSNIPKSTFKRHLLGVNKKAKNGTKSLELVIVISEEIEGQIMQHIFKMDSF